MTIDHPLLVGAAIGLLLGLGLALVVIDNPWVRPPDLASRVDPYLRRGRGSGLLSAGRAAGPARSAVRVLAGPLAGRAVGTLERLTGSAAQLERRIRLAGSRGSVESFRVEQVVWGIAGGTLGFLGALGAVVLRGTSPLLGLAMIAVGAVGGIVARDAMLSRAISRRAARMAREFPTVADLLALAVAAGEGPVAAMERVARTSQGALPSEFAGTVAEIRAGATVTQALIGLGERTPLDALGRFGEGIAVAVERGTPLADVLRAQAQDAREAAKRDLMELAGRREIAMMAPVVFFILPLVIVFAVFPGLAVLDISL